MTPPQQLTPGDRGTMWPLRVRAVDLRSRHWQPHVTLLIAPERLTADRTLELHLQ